MLVMNPQQYAAVAPANTRGNTSTRYHFFRRSSSSSSRVIEAVLLYSSYNKEEGSCALFFAMSCAQYGFPGREPRVLSVLFSELLAKDHTHANGGDGARGGGDGDAGHINAGLRGGGACVGGGAGDGGGINRDGHDREAIG